MKILTQVRLTGQRDRRVGVHPDGHPHPDTYRVKVGPRYGLLDRYRLNSKTSTGRCFNLHAPKYPATTRYLLQMATNADAAAAMRVTHRQVSLEALGRMMDPPMTKDAVAGRIGQD